MPWDALGCPGMPWDALGASAMGLFQDGMAALRILWDLFSLFFCGKVMIKDQFDKWFGGTVPCCKMLYPIFRQSWKIRSIDPGWAFKHQRHSLCGHEHLRSQCTKGLPLVGKVSKYVNSMKSFKNSIPWHPINVWLIHINPQFSPKTSQKAPPKKLMARPVLWLVRSWQRSPRFAAQYVWCCFFGSN